jgi:hypothetical protein
MDFIWFHRGIWFRKTSALLTLFVFSGFSKVWFFHTLTTWKRCEMATVSSVIFAGAHKYLQSFWMSIQYPWNVCDVWKKISLFPSYLAHPYQHQHVPTRRLNVANRLVRTATMHYCRPALLFSKLPYVHISSTKRLWRVKKFSLFPSYLAHPYQHQHVPTRRLNVANRLVRTATMHYWRPV